MSDSTDSYSIVRFTTKERPTDRYLRAVTEKLKSPYGELTAIGVTEIADRWNPAIETGEMIWQTFVRQFTSSRAKSILTKFEDALKNINQLLETSEEKISQPINCVIAILNGTDLYFSTINQGEILLWRSTKITKITSPAGGRFTTVTSGELQKKDGLVFGSQRLIRIVQPLADDPSTKKARSERLEETITKQETEIGQELAGIVVEIGQKSEVKTVYLDEASKGSLLKKMAWPQLAQISTWWNRAVTPTIQHFRRWHKSRAKTPTVVDQTDNDQTIKDASGRPLLARRRRPTFKRSLILPIAFSILLIVGVVIIYTQLKKLTDKEPTVSTPTIAELIAKTPENELFSFISQNLTIDNYQELTDRQRASFNDTLTKTGRAIVTQDAKILDAPEPIVALDSTATNLYLLDRTGQLWRYKDSLTKVSQKALITGPVSLTALSDNKILVSDQAGGIWLFNGSGDQPVSLALPQHLAQGVKLLQKFGSSNLYLYQTTSQTIYKVGGFISELGAEPSVWVEPATLNFGALADWTVPGDFVGVADDGKIRSFNRTKLAGLSIDYYQDNVPLRLATTTTENQLTVVRGKFITTYSTDNGSKTSEKVLVTTDLIADVSIRPDKTVWVAAGRSLYKLP